MNQSITKLEFAWNSLTEQQQFRINVKYDLVNRLNNLKPVNGKIPYGQKTFVYKIIAEEYNYTIRTIKKIALELNDKL